MKAEDINSMCKDIGRKCRAEAFLIGCDVVRMLRGQIIREFPDGHILIHHDSCGTWNIEGANFCCECGDNVKPFTRTDEEKTELINELTQLGIL